jgi:hypothetical protein
MSVQEERPSTCQHVHQRLSRCLRQRKSQPCSGLTRRQLPGGQRLESSRRSGRSAVTAGTGRPKFVPFWRVSRSSARNEARPLSGTTPERLAGSTARPAGGHLPKAVGGVDPGGQHTASGGALRVRCDEASVSGSRGRSGLLALVARSHSRIKVLAPPRSRAAFCHQRALDRASRFSAVPWDR